MSGARAPKVSIGMPVRNGEPHLRAALDSLVAQTFTDFELIVSDNASTDATGAICREYAAADARIRYVRQDEDLGAFANFRFVVEQAAGEYFMWAAADDTRAPGFVETNLAFLEDHPAYVGAMTRCRHGDIEDDRRTGCRPIAGDTFADRLASFLEMPGSNARFYGLYRLAPLQGIAVDDHDYLGGDWAIIAELLRHGSIGLSTTEAMFFKRRGPSADVVRLAEATRRSALERFVPYARLGRYLLGLAERPALPVWRFIVRANVSFVRRYWVQRLKRALRVS